MKDKQFWSVAGIIFVLFMIYWFAGHPFFVSERSVMFWSILVVGGVLIYSTRMAKRGEKITLRSIPGLKAVEEAVGRSTEMGKPVLYVPGIMDMDQVETVAGVVVLGHVAKMTARYETSLNVPVSRAIVMKAARESCRESYLMEGRPDLFHDDMVHYLTDDQFAYAAGVNGIMIREEPAACLYMGKFYAESLLLAETGNSIGAIQIAGTASPSQIPFFVTACDYTLIGEEFFAASAYLSQDPELIGGVKGQDYLKILFTSVLLLSVLLFSMNIFEQQRSDEWKDLKQKTNLSAEKSIATFWNNADPVSRYQAVNRSLSEPSVERILNKYKNLAYSDLSKRQKNNIAFTTGTPFWIQLPVDNRMEIVNQAFTDNNQSSYDTDAEFRQLEIVKEGKNKWNQMGEDEREEYQVKFPEMNREALYAEIGRETIDWEDHEVAWAINQRSIPVIKNILMVQ